MEIPGRVQEQCSVSCCADKAMENGSLGQSLHKNSASQVMIVWRYRN